MCRKSRAVRLSTETAALGTSKEHDLMQSKKDEKDVPGKVKVIKTATRIKEGPRRAVTNCLNPQHPTWYKYHQEQFLSTKP